MGVVDIIILSGFGLFILINLIVIFTWGRKIRWPEGNRVQYKYNDYTAIVIVDKEIPLVGDDFILGETKINKHKLAKACAVSMESMNYTAKNFGPDELKVPGTLNECVFIVSNPKKFTKELESNYLKDKEYVQGFANISDFRRMGAARYYCCYMRSKHLSEIIKRGQLAIHEYLHAYSHKLTGNWDDKHLLWQFKTEEGRDIDRTAQERVKSIMNLDN